MTNLSPSHDVKVIEELSLFDEKRKKDIQARISFPDSEGSHPVIVFSHGAGASRNEYLALTHFWASHGYVVIQPTHADSVVLRQSLGQTSSLPIILAEARKDYKGWVDRCSDLSFVIDSLTWLNHEHPLLKNRIDTNTVGLAGHSYGAYTALLLSGAKLELDHSDLNQSLVDERIQATILMSPPGSNQQGLTANSFASLHLPMMLMTGSRDKGLSGQPAEWRTEAFHLSATGGKYLVFIEGATHLTFAAGRATLTTQPPQQIPSATILGGTEKAPEYASKFDQRAILGYIKLGSLAFWNAYLKRQAASQAYLASTDLQKLSQHLVRIDLR